jgi:DNA-binding PadR family transcriptional regulator
MMRLSPVSYTVLGLIGLRGPSTPYELKSTAARSIAYFWPFPHSQLYSEPTRLAKAGLLVETRESGGRNRKVYSLTDEGRRALTDWLAKPPTEIHELRDMALLQLQFFESASEAELIALARARPGALNYASAGNGSMHHMGTEYLKHRAGIDMLHVPYRGTGETISDLIAGRIDFYMNSPPPLTPLVREGRLRALCVSSDARHPGLPDIPSAAEQGFAGMPLNVWFSVFAPRGVPAATVALLSEKLNLVLSDARLRERAAQAGALVSPSSAAQLAERVARETDFWRETARVAGITAG